MLLIIRLVIWNKREWFHFMISIVIGIWWNEHNFPYIINPGRGQQHLGLVYGECTEMKWSIAE